ncbi:MAG TPA: ABC transporter permease [Methanomassiliicoccales archaeon]|nr:ABC transporter permease [Methanomassiliicoccales archaeon]
MSDGPLRYFKSLPKGLLENYARQLIITVVALVSFIAVWWAVALWQNLPYLPPPDKVFWALVESFTKQDASLGTDMWGNIAASLQRFAIGFIFAFLVAVPLGLVMGFFKIADSFFKPIVEIFRPMPPIAWVPIFLLIFGIYWGPVMVIFLGVLFPLLSSVIFGVKSVDKPLIDAAKTMGANRMQQFTKVVFPYTVPFLMTGITIGLGIGWMCIVAAEIIGAVGGGVGFYINYTKDLGRFDLMYAGMVVIAILGICTVGASRLIERRLNQRMGVK